jgi:hypothetical protein
MREAWLVRGISTAACYANYDSSTLTPVLNVADFTCFLQRFAGGASYANCDLSTTPPTLNVEDFTCFLQSGAHAASKRAAKRASSGPSGAQGCGSRRWCRCMARELTAVASYSCLSSTGTA